MLAAPGDGSAAALDAPPNRLNPTQPHLCFYLQLDASRPLLIGD
jgi:hypothetical protein